MINLVITASCASLPSLATVIENFSRQGSLTWLAHASSPVPPSPANVPVLTRIEDLPSSGQLIILIAPPDEQIANTSKGHRVMRIYERDSQAWRNAQRAVVVDDLARLELLTTLSDYPGMSRLLACSDWTAEDFRGTVLSRYASALDALRTMRRAAVFGAQRLGERVCSSLHASGITVATLIDNGESKHGTYIDGISVLPLSALTDKDLPIVIATTRFTSSITRQLEDEGFRHVLPYSVMTLVDAERYPDEIPYIGIQQDFAEHAANYLGLFLALSDDKSRRVLDGLIRYRLDYDSRYALSVTDEYARQYFDANLIRYSGADIFVDLGGYDGDTVEKFIEFSGGSYEQIYLFEPDSNLIKRAKERLKSDKSIEFIEAGAYSKDGELRFATTGRTNGSVSDAGELIIPVRKLDSALNVAPTLIKIDIEGSETNALQGAADLLRTARPKLAVAAYHFAPDLWRLADVVREINPSYRFYLRHYSETGLESVIYAV
jgi:FkbM family methyltransferase